MLFSSSATQALRAMASLAGGVPSEPVLGRDLARRIGLPGHNLSKVLARMARSGLLKASRGARGGYRLARRPDRIKPIEVVLPLEGAGHGPAVCHDPASRVVIPAPARRIRPGAP